MIGFNHFHIVKTYSPSLTTLQNTPFFGTNVANVSTVSIFVSVDGPGSNRYFKIRFAKTSCISIYANRIPIQFLGLRKIFRYLCRNHYLYHYLPATEWQKRQFIEITFETLRSKLLRLRPKFWIVVD